MSNHHHLVLKVDRERCLVWSDDEVIDRWYELFNRHRLVERLRSGESLPQAERDAALELVNTWRNRLMNLSWYMRSLNEYIARLANEEDKRNGRFWEGRYKSRALLDKTALISCMRYVNDRNGDERADASPSLIARKPNQHSRELGGNRSPEAESFLLASAFTQ